VGLRESLAANAQDFALQHYTHSAVADAYLKQFAASFR
jgi:hypothetical protein